MAQRKLEWRGEVLGVQPRIRLLRSFDQRSHAYLGYHLRVRGALDDEAREFVAAVGMGAHRKHSFRVGDEVAGLGVPVADQRLEAADLYKVSRVRVLERGAEEAPAGPPVHGIAPPLEEYRARGHRRLAAATYREQCWSCIWGAEMAVEITLDQWDPGKKRYRRETFCYGPKSCPLYRPGATRKVPGRRGMTWEEEDWVDEQATAHRGPEE